METLFIAAALVAGGLLALQAGANAQLAEAVGSPFGATTIQLSVGTFLLVLVAALTGGLVALASLPQVPWWHAVGGTASAFYVISTILLFPRLGAVVSVGLFIAGQMLASLALDGFGLLGVPMAGLTTSAFLGTLAVLSGAALIVFGQERRTDNLSASSLGWIVLALLAGAVLPGARRGERPPSPGPWGALRGRRRFVLRGHPRHGRSAAACDGLPPAPTEARRPLRHALVGLARGLRGSGLRHHRVHRDPRYR